MSTEKIQKVLSNCQQGLTDIEKAQARANIDAQAQLTAGDNVTIDANNVISATGLSGVSAVAPLYGDGTSENKLILRTSHGLSLVQNSEDHITRLQVTHPVPAPGSTSTNKVLTCVDALENLEWRNVPTGPSIEKKNYGDLEPSGVNTLLLDSDDPEGYALVKADNAAMGYLVQGPYKGLLDSGINSGSGVGDATTPVYIDSNGQFAACTLSPGQGGKKKHTAELYFHHSDDGDHYNVRDIKNYCVNHVVVHNHSQDICYIHIEAPTIASDEEYDYTVVFDCTGSSGWCNVTVENCDAEVFDQYTFNAVPQWLAIHGSDTSSDATTLTKEIRVLDANNAPKYLEIEQASYASVPPAHPAGPAVLTAASTLSVQQVKRNRIGFSGSPQYQVEVLGGRFTVHAF